MKFSAVFFVLMSTVSCSTVDNQPCEINHSRAYCLLDLVGISKGVKEVQIDKHIDADQININTAISDKRNINQDDLIAAAIYQFGGKSIPSITTGIPAIPLLFLALSGDQNVGSASGVFATVPQSEIKYGSSLRTVELAMIAAAEKATGSSIAREPDHIKHSGMFNKETWRVFKMSGGRCTQDPCFFHMDFSLVEGSELSTPKSIVQPPSWLSKEGIHVFTQTVPRYYALNRGGNRVNLMKSSDYETIFKYLPRWIYFYAPINPPVVFNSEGIMPLVTTSKN